MVVVTAVAAVTVGSRVAATALLPTPRGGLAELIKRLPAPLFAALAAVSLRGSDAGTADPAMLLAVGCALASTRWRSLLLTVAAGLAGFLIGDTLS
jgi:hypothetical protein